MLCKALSFIRKRGNLPALRPGPILAAAFPGAARLPAAAAFFPGAARLPAAAVNFLGVSQPPAAIRAFPEASRLRKAAADFSAPCRRPYKMPLILFLPPLLLAVLSLTPAAARGAVPRFGLDQQNSRQVREGLKEMNLPFQKKWQKDLGAPVESQPILCNGSIYVQAGDRLYRLDTEGSILAVSPRLSESPTASGSSPTFTYSAFGPRIYQATRDHRLWALEPDTLAPLWEDPGYLVLSAGGHPELRYRVTASPLAVNRQGKTLIALGTAQGDQTGLEERQYADNGFFILEDLGSRAKVRYCRQVNGEVTGSPVQMEDLIVATQNMGARPGERDLLLCYDLAFHEEVSDTAAVPTGIPGSPAVEGDRVWLADGQGRLYCYQRQPDRSFRLLWVNEDDRAGSVNLNSPAVGSEYIYLPVRLYKNSGGGALIAVEKESGRTAAVRLFDSALCANPVYWLPPEYGPGYLLVYEAAGDFRFLDGGSLEPAAGFLDENGSLRDSIRLTGAVAGRKVSDPVMTEEHLILVDSQGTLHVYQGRGRQLPTALEDLTLAGLTAPAKTAPDKVETVKARVRNNGRQFLEGCILEWYEDGRLKLDQLLDLGPGEEKEVSWLWPGRKETGLAEIEACIRPPLDAVDPDGGDNRKSLLIEVARQGETDCGRLRENGSWTVSYRVLTGYETGEYLDCGDSPSLPCQWVTYTDYSRPIYQRQQVTYREELKAEAAISTGQGSLGVPGGETAADLEGRGAWEIIPYAQKQGLDPDKITRAGAGVYLRVETVFSTDWESRAPDGAEAYGGGAAGPGKAAAEIYDTRGRLIKSLDLEKTRQEESAGPSGETKITQVWELPEESHVYLDGRARKSRRFFTSPDLPDGRLRLLVRISGAGKNLLHTCKLVQAEVYGSIYDDIYNRLKNT